MAAVSRRVELEQILENDIAELAQLQESLAKTNVLTERMGGMLTSFEDRLAKLESSILPIHKSTKHLTKLHENIEKSLDHVDEIMSYLGLAAKEDIFISKGPAKNEDITEYLTVVSKLKDALNHLQTLDYKSGETATMKLKLVLTKAHFHIETLFRKKLSALSIPIEITPENDAQLPRISESDLEELVLLTGQLAPLDRIIGENTDVYEHLKTYSEVRSLYLVKSLGTLSHMSMNTVRASSSTYQKGSSPFICYMLYFLRMCKAEKALIQKLIIKPQAQHCYLQTTSAASEAFTETGESIIARVKRNLAKKEYIDLFMLIDVSSNLAEYLKQYDAIVAFSGNKGAEMAELVSNSKIIILSFFREFCDEIKHQEPVTTTTALKAATSPQTHNLPVDGTVHELSSVTLNIVRRLLEYEPAINTMLIEGHSAANLTSNNLKSLCKEMLSLLFTSLENKSKGYKKGGILGCIFLINNYHYVAKQIKSMGPILLDSEFEFEKAFLKQKETYKASWTPCYQYLMDQTKIEGGNVVKTLSKQQRESIKDRFKNFNAEIDSMYATQKGYTLADPELRNSIMKEIKDVLIPLYAHFQERYMQIEFSKTPSKYIKYDKNTLDAVLDGFLTGSADVLEKKFFPSFDK
ncbi:Cullin repeat-like-containing domain protein [Obelidium mucronatum]|nr:Cullin repeat-like-containing domain protein [Obelidium mucronatum]